MQFPNIDPTAFEIFGVEIKWYGVSYALSLFLALYFCKFLAKKYKVLNSSTFEDVLIWSALGIIIGGRLGYIIFYDFNYYINNLSQIFLGIRKGGMSFHGGILGVTLACYVYSKIKKISFLSLMDVISCSAPIGLFFGRLANFINSELWGKQTSFFLGIVFPNGGPLPRHPSQIYEALLEGLLLFIIVNFFYNKKHFISGYTASIFLIFYSIFRIIAEFYREPDIHIGYIIEPYVSMGVILCLPMFFIGISVLFINVKNFRNIKKKY